MDSPDHLSEVSELCDRVVSLGKAGDADGAAATCDELISRFGNEPDPAIRQMVAQTLYNKGTMFRFAGRTSEAAQAFDEVLVRFGDGPETGVLVMAAMALYNKGVALRDDRQALAAVTAFDEMPERFGNLANATIRERVVASLLIAAECLVGEGQIDPALSRLEDLVSRYSTAPEPEIRVLVANALLIRGRALQQQGNPWPAIAAFDDLILGFADSADPNLQPFVAAALVDKGTALGDVHHYEEAVVVFEGVLRHFDTSVDPNIREQVARALYFKGSALMGYEPIEAGAMFDDLLRRFEHETLPTIVNLVEQGRRSRDELQKSPPRADRDLRNILLLINYQDRPASSESTDRAAMPLPASHARMDPFEAATASELEREWLSHAVWPAVPPLVAAGLFAFRVVRWPSNPYGRALTLLAGAAYGVYWIRHIRLARVARQYIQSHRRLVGERIRDAAFLHRFAAGLLARCRAENRPFALFLRNFDVEAYERLASEPSGQPQQISMSLGNFARVERKIAAALSSRLPVVGIANPAVIRPDYRHAIPKLELPNDQWREYLKGLVRDAAFVVMQLEKLSAGVSIELSAILEQHKQDKTVVILAGPGSPDAQPDPFETAMKGYFGMGGDSKLPDKSNPQLGEFSRTVFEEEIPFELLDLSPVFRDLLPRRSWN